MSPITVEYSTTEVVDRLVRQSSIYVWCVNAFAEQDSTPRVRMLRFVEEAVELAQAHGLGIADVHGMVDSVFARPIGEVKQEVGGVMVTLQAYCEAAGIEVVSCERAELIRINAKPVEHFQRRQREKAEAGLL